ncbi:hypothetical protein NEOC65_000829 [Neochlamydia sp. AcF65]|nr:hypothetical protein [Neochlamydia sp. AcF65]MBS4171146.1 hypothetical protein [Neochlamydia sp. AcF95]
MPISFSLNPLKNQFLGLLPAYEEKKGFDNGFIAF